MLLGLEAWGVTWGSSRDPRSCALCQRWLLSLGNHSLYGGDSEARQVSSFSVTFCSSTAAHACCLLHVSSGLLFRGVASAEACGSPCTGSMKMAPQTSSLFTFAWVASGLCRQGTRVTVCGGPCLLWLESAGSQIPFSPPNPSPHVSDQVVGTGGDQRGLGVPRVSSELRAPGPGPCG